MLQRLINISEKLTRDLHKDNTEMDVYVTCFHIDEWDAKISRSIEPILVHITYDSYDRFIPLKIGKKGNVTKQKVSYDGGIPYGFVELLFFEEESQANEYFILQHEKYIKMLEQNIIKAKNNLEKFRNAC